MPKLPGSSKQRLAIKLLSRLIHNRGSWSNDVFSNRSSCGTALGQRSYHVYTNIWLPLLRGFHVAKAEGHSYDRHCGWAWTKRTSSSTVALHWWEEQSAVKWRATERSSVLLLNFIAQKISVKRRGSWAVGIFVKHHLATTSAISESTLPPMEGSQLSMKEPLPHTFDFSNRDYQYTNQQWEKR